MPDLEALLQPISDENPCGPDLSFSAAFDRIAAARREDDPTLDQGEWVTNLKEADWPSVIRQTEELLTRETKDIRLAVWMTEALCKTRRFAGLAEGFGVLDALCEKYWDGLHPLPDGDDQEQRIGNLGWLVQRAAVLVRQMPVTGGNRGYSFNDLQSAQSLQTAMDRDPDNAAGLGEGKLTVAMFQSAVGDSGRQFHEDLSREVGEARAALAKFGEHIDARLGTDGPSFKPLQDALEEVGNLVERGARQLGVGSVGAGNAGAAGGHEDAASAVGAVSGPVRSRAQALLQLRQVADYFRRTEPHSPVAYLADKAAQWGDMPLHAWLRTVVKDGGALSHLEEMLGIDRPKSDSSDE